MHKTQISRLDDHQLVLLVAQEDMRAFEVIYDRHSAQAFGLAMRVTGRQRGAEESTQDAFVSFWRTAKTYDTSRGTFKTWLLSMVRNRSIDWLRREARHNLSIELDDVLAGRLEAAERTETAAAEREESSHVRQLLASLPSEQRQVIELAYFKGLTQVQIAAKIDIPLGTVKGRQRLALAKLRRTLTSLPNARADGAKDDVLERQREIVPVPASIEIDPPALRYGLLMTDQA